MNVELAFRLSEQDHAIATLREENDLVTRMLVDLKVENAEKENECMRLQQRLKKALRFENQVGTNQSVGKGSESSHLYDSHQHATSVDAD